MQRLKKKVLLLLHTAVLYIQGVRVGDNYLDIETGELSQYQGGGRWSKICAINVTSDAPDYILIS